MASALAGRALVGGTAVEHSFKHTNFALGVDILS
jgi:hypothetical protein